MNLLTKAILFLKITLILAPNPNCTVESSCTCDLKSAGLLNLAESFDGEDFAEIEGSDGYTYRYYPCGMRLNWGIPCSYENSPIACQYTQTEYYVLGKSTNYNITTAVADGYKTYFVFQFFDGTFDALLGPRKANVRIECDTTGSSNFQFISESPHLTYNFLFKTEKACLIPPNNESGLAIFITVIVLIPVLIIAYLLIGTSVLYFKGARGLKLIPNLEFWKDSPFLFIDGFLCLFSCIPAVRERLRIVAHQNYEKI